MLILRTLYKYFVLIHFNLIVPICLDDRFVLFCFVFVLFVFCLFVWFFFVLFCFVLFLFFLFFFFLFFLMFDIVHDSD